MTLNRGRAKVQFICSAVHIYMLNCPHSYAQLSTFICLTVHIYMLNYPHLYAQLSTFLSSLSEPIFRICPISCQLFCCHCVVRAEEEETPPSSLKTSQLSNRRTDQTRSCTRTDCYLTCNSRIMPSLSTHRASTASGLRHDRLIILRITLSLPTASVLSRD